MTTYGVLSTGFVPKPVTAIIADIEAAQTSTIDAALNTAPTGPIGQINGVAAAAIAEVWELAQAAYNAFNPDDVEGVAADNLGAVRGEKRLPPSPSSVFCTCTLLAANSPYLAGTLVANVAGNPAAQFSNSADVVVTVDGSVQVLFKALVNGPTAAGAGTLTVITAPVTGWSAVTNALPATPGILSESDAVYLARQEAEIGATGACTVQAETSQLLQVPGVVTATVLENISDVYDPVLLMPAHSIQAIVFDGIGALAQNAAIALALWNDKPSGCATYGSTSAQIVDSLGVTRTVNFTRPTQLPVYMALTVTLGAGVVLATIAPIIKSALVNLSNGLTPAGLPLASGTPGALVPGGNVEALLYRACARAVSGVTGVPALALAYTPGPVATADLATSQTQIATLVAGNLTVNGI